MRWDNFIRWKQSRKFAALDDFTSSFSGEQIFFPSANPSTQVNEDVTFLVRALPIWVRLYSKDIRDIKWLEAFTRAKINKYRFAAIIIVVVSTEKTYDLFPSFTTWIEVCTQQQHPWNISA